jgi:hypothetical protein
VIYRRDLIDHFGWLAGSGHFDEVVDEALVAIAFAARGQGEELVEVGAAWMSADGVVEKFKLEAFAEKARDGLPFRDGLVDGRGWVRTSDLSRVRRALSR